MCPIRLPWCVTINPHFLEDFTTRRFRLHLPSCSDIHSIDNTILWSVFCKWFDLGWSVVHRLHSKWCTSVEGYSCETWGRSEVVLNRRWRWQWQWISRSDFGFEDLKLGTEVFEEIIESSMDPFFVFPEFKSLSIGKVENGTCSHEQKLSMIWDKSSPTRISFLPSLHRLHHLPLEACHHLHSFWILFIQYLTWTNFSLLGLDNSFKDSTLYLQGGSAVYTTTGEWLYSYLDDTTDVK